MTREILSTLQSPRYVRADQSRTGNQEQPYPAHPLARHSNASGRCSVALRLVVRDEGGFFSRFWGAGIERHGAHHSTVGCQSRFGATRCQWSTIGSQRASGALGPRSTKAGTLAARADELASCRQESAMRRKGQTSRLDDGSRSICSWCRNTRGDLCELRRSDNPESDERTVRWSM